MRRRTLEIEVYVNSEYEDERVIVVTDYHYTPGSRGHTTPHGDCAGCPSDSAMIEDIECHWKDNGQALSDDEWRAYGDEIDEACWAFQRDDEQAAEDAATDHEIQRWKERKCA